MNFVLYPAIFATLGSVAYQDFKSREVWIWFFVFFLIESVIFVGRIIPFKSLLLFTGINLCIIAFQFFTLTAFFSLKNKGLTNIINKYIGIGDLVFFVIMALWFSPFNFSCFMLASFIAGLLSVVFVKRNNIPLAGVMSIVLAFVLIVQTITKGNLYNDYFVINLLGLR